LSDLRWPLAGAVAGQHRVLTEYNAKRHTAVQVVPAPIGVILRMTMLVFTAIALVRERERVRRAGEWQPRRSVPGRFSSSPTCWRWRDSKSGWIWGAHGRRALASASTWNLAMLAPDE
jgi:hypothetical protein